MSCVCRDIKAATVNLQSKAFKAGLLMLLSLHSLYFFNQMGLWNLLEVDLKQNAAQKEWYTSHAACVLACLWLFQAFLLIRISSSCSS